MHLAMALEVPGHPDPLGQRGQQLTSGRSSSPASSCGPPPAQPRRAAISRHAPAGHEVYKDVEKGKRPYKQRESDQRQR